MFSCLGLILIAGLWGILWAHLPALLTSHLWSQGPSPEPMPSLQLDPPFLFAEPGRAGDATVLSLLVLE